VPYKDYGQWFADISNGTLSYSFVTVASTGALEKAGKIRYLATTASQRDPKYPTLPTMQELTGQAFYGIAWAGFYVANGMPEAREKELKLVLDLAFGLKEVAATLDALNYNYRNLGVAEFRKFVQQDQTKYKEAFRKNNIKLD
jgi:tripartite-type tricarboxylate transporter receptor subunit TctC